MNKTLTALVALIVTGCATPGTLKTYLEERKDPLVYLYVSEKADEKKRGALSVGSFSVDDVLPPETSIKQVSQSVTPLIVWNTWNQKLQAQLGHPQIAGDYKQFMQDSFIRELKRSGNAEYMDGGGDLVLDVHVKKVELSAPIVQRGQFLFLVFIFAFGTETIAGPVDVSVLADIRLSRSGTELLAKEVYGRSSTGIIRGGGVHFVTYHTAVMIEGLSLAIRDLNEKIVKEVNRV